MPSLFRQLRTALRTLVRQPAATLWIVATLALGIGATTAMFSYLAAWIWPRVDAPDPERAVYLWAGSREEPRALLSLPDFQDLERGPQAIRDLIGYAPFGCTVASRGATTFAWGQTVSGGYFSYFAARPATGRLLEAQDDRPGAERVVVLTYPFWQRAFGGDPGIVGKTVRLNGHPFLVVGLTARRFQGQGRAGALYIANVHSDAVTGLERLADRDKPFLGAMARLAPGSTLAAARAALGQWGRSLDGAVPLHSGPRRPGLVAATRYDSANGADFFLEEAKVLTLAATLFLLLACASVANLLLARATARRHDAGLRAALGASRAQIALGVLLEASLLALAGGGAGLGLGLVFARRLERYATTAPVGLGTWSEGTEVLRLDTRMAGIALAAVLLAALLCSLGPILQALRSDLLVTLKSEGGGGSAGRALASRRLLVIVQVALSAVLLVGAGLLARTLRGAEDVPLGFDLDRFLLATVYVPRVAGTPSASLSILPRLLERARAQGGFEAVGAVSNPPLSGFNRQTRVAALESRERAAPAAYNLVSDGFFDALNIRLREGRPIDGRDLASAPPVVVVDRALAERTFGTAHAVGRTLFVPEPPRPGATGSLFQVVGVAENVRYSSVLDRPAAVVYFSIFQQTTPRLTLAVRTRSPLGQAERHLTRAVSEADAGLSIVEVASGREALRSHLFLHRMQAEVASLFGALGLLVAALGLYGLLSYTVTLRARELAIRGAVGALPRDIVRLVVRQGMTLAAIGLAAGVLGGLALTRFLRTLLFGVSPGDPATFVAVAALLAGVAALAVWLPARRAAGKDPLEVLREA
jgi:predicted permease